ncbi:MAG TPA: hypothetical protein VFT68_10925 [Lapillicoccus sp.]|nr:hypothetical protein [Lapillicoccus sp.]
MVRMRVTVATITLERGDNAGGMLRAMQSLADQGYAACVGDGGSSAEFVERLEAMGHHVEQPGRHLRGQMESAFRAAAERGTHVFYFESDKVEFVETRLPATLRRYRSRRLDFATIGRPRREWYTFPGPQVEIERAQSTLIGGMVGIPGDWVAGPALMPSAHVATLAESRWDGTDRHGWGVPWFLLGRAWRNGLAVGLIRTAPGVDPSARNEFNPGYRFYQADSILGSFYEGAGVDYDWRDSKGVRE